MRGWGVEFSSLGIRAHGTRASGIHRGLGHAASLTCQALHRAVLSQSLAQSYGDAETVACTDARLFPAQVP